MRSPGSKRPGRGSLPHVSAVRRADRRGASPECKRPRRQAFEETGGDGGRPRARSFEGASPESKRRRRPRWCRSLPHVSGGRRARPGADDNPVDTRHVACYLALALRNLHEAQGSGSPGAFSLLFWFRRRAPLRGWQSARRGRGLRPPSHPPRSADSQESNGSHASCWLDQVEAATIAAPSLRPRGPAGRSSQNRW